MLDDLHMRLGPVTLAELPHVDDITIKNKGLRRDGFEIAKEFFGVTAVGAEMNIRKNYQVKLPLSLFAQGGEIWLNKSTGITRELCEENVKVSGVW